MGLDQYGQIRNKKIDFEKVYSDNYEPTVDGFVWRKHTRLQTFMSDKFAELNPNTKHTQHLSLIHISEPTRPY